MIAVTGATGHIGNVLVRELIARGKKVRAVIPPGEDTCSLQGLNVEMVPGDVRDLDSLCRAFSDIEIVFHLAGIISILPGKQKLLETGLSRAKQRQRVDALAAAEILESFLEGQRGGS